MGRACAPPACRTAVDDLPKIHRVPAGEELDLHTFAARDAASVVEEYVNAAHEAGLRAIRIIHGRGKGVRRGIVQAVLERHPLVEQFWDAPESHLGATVARLSQNTPGTSRHRTRAR